MCTECDGLFIQITCTSATQIRRITPGVVNEIVCPSFVDRLYLVLNEHGHRLDCKQIGAAWSVSCAMLFRNRGTLCVLSLPFFFVNIANEFLVRRSIVGQTPMALPLDRSVRRTFLPIVVSHQLITDNRRDERMRPTKTNDTVALPARHQKRERADTST